jgi:uncharacterized membrane protein YfcA
VDFDLWSRFWDLLDVTVWQALGAIGIVAFGGTISGLTGFGFGLVIVPVLLMIFPASTVVILSKSLGLGSGLPIVLQDWRSVRPRLIAGLFIPACVGLALGTVVLKHADTRVIKLVVGITVVIFSIVIARGFIIPGIRSRPAPLVAGFASGILGTSTGMSGPPAVLYLTDRDLAPRIFRASLVAYFFCIDVIAVGLIFRAGLIERHDIALAGLLYPFALGGRQLGQRFLDRVDRAQFRKITLALLVATGISAMISALASFA